MTETKAFFKRSDFKDQEKKPLWHRFVSSEIVTDNYKRKGIETPYRAARVVALCGYRYSAGLTISPEGDGLSLLDWRDDVKTSTLRCASCDAKAGIKRRKTKAQIAAARVKANRPGKPSQNGFWSLGEDGQPVFSPPGTVRS